LPPLTVVDPRPARIPLSLAQTRLWLLNRIDPDSAVYTLPIALRLTGDLDTDALWAALGDVLARHESLRTVFPEDAEGPTQVVLPVDRVLPVADVREVAEADLADAVRAIIGAGYDLTSQPPVRAALLRRVPDDRAAAPVGRNGAAFDGAAPGIALPNGTEPHGAAAIGTHRDTRAAAVGTRRDALSGSAIRDGLTSSVARHDGRVTDGVVRGDARVDEVEHVLVLAVHHIAADGVSTTPLARDLVTAYVARSAGTAPAGEPLPVQYPDFTLWQHAVLGDAADPESRLARQLAHWRDELAGLAPALELATDRPRPAVRTGAGGSVGFDVPADVVTGIEEVDTPWRRASSS
ncbi:condensation domain-containing protein, partial [Gordonia aichiensis]